MAARGQTVLTPEQRIYPAEGQDIADTAIRTTGFRISIWRWAMTAAMAAGPCAPMSVRWRLSSGWARW